MTTPVNDDVWKRRGINILWDGESLAELKATDQVISLRRFFELYSNGWVEDDMPLVDDEALIVAGLDVAIDSLSPADAENWLEQVVYKRIVSFQNEFAQGSCALIFWMAESKRWKENLGNNTYSWHCSGKYKGKLLPIGKCLWNGAEKDAQPIEILDSKKNHKRIGLYHKRIS